jgi:hypothetical protein
MSPSDVNLSTSFVVFHPCLIHPPRLEHRFPQPYLLPRRDWPTEDPFETFATAEANGQVGTQSLSYRLSTCGRKPTRLPSAQLSRLPE